MFTELDVLKATRKWFDDIDHYTADTYHEIKEEIEFSSSDFIDINLYESDYAEKVARTCAIGGVEHSIYLLAKAETGVAGISISDVDRSRLAYTDEPLSVKVIGEERLLDRPYLETYNLAMSRCNKVTVQIFGNLVRETFYQQAWHVENFEQLTDIEGWSTEQAFKAIRRVLNAAIKECKAEMTQVG